MATKKRLNFTLTNDIVKELKGIAPGRRSGFVNMAIRNEILRMRRDKFLKKYLKSKRPIWTDENHPDLITEEDIANYRPTKSRKIVNW